MRIQRNRGGLATGLFVGIGFPALADGVSRGEQVLYQLTGVGAPWGWASVTTAIIVLAIMYTIRVRVREEEEQAGLDISQHAEEAYDLLGDAFPVFAGGSGEEPTG